MQIWHARIFHLHFENLINNAPLKSKVQRGNTASFVNHQFKKAILIRLDRLKA